MDTTRSRAPEIDYLARDYASFRQLLLDQISLLAPGWQESSVADVGHVVVDLLAYAADYLAYYQDAVATETYLGTARLRRSVRRHARLLDYYLHDGCNARTWVHIRVELAQTLYLPAGTVLVTQLGDGGTAAVIGSQDARIAAGPLGPHQAFETMHDCLLASAHNEIAFYTERREDRVLRRGVTSARLEDRWLDNDHVGRHLDTLQPGDLLLFEELIDPATGRPGSGDPAHRHVVRLTSVDRSAPAAGPLHVTVRWDAADALPFDLPIGHHHAAFGQEPIQISVARGNVVLADQGWRISDEVLPPSRGEVRYRPYLKHRHVAFAEPYDHAEAMRLPAAHAVQQDPQLAQAVIHLTELHDYVLDGESGTPPLLATASTPPGMVYRVAQAWTLRRELLSSEYYSCDYAVETEEDGRAYLRFGFGGMGRRPASDGTLSATYRVGTGSAGNVGRETIVHLVSDDPAVRAAVRQVRNPLPVTSGKDPEQIEEARLNAPQAFKVPLSCITAEDYAAHAARHPAVCRARAEIVHTGSWTTARIYVQRCNSRPADTEFRADIRRFLLPLAMSGHEVVVSPPRYVGLDLRLRVLVKPEHFRLGVRHAIESALSTGILSGGHSGFFHPDRLDFGQPIYRSQVIARVMAVEGVARAEIEHLSRAGGPGDADPVLIGPLEIARLDRDPARPENGTLTLIVEGGR